MRHYRSPDTANERSNIAELLSREHTIRYSYIRYSAITSQGAGAHHPTATHCTTASFLQRLQAPLLCISSGESTTCSYQEALIASQGWACWQDLRQHGDLCGILSALIKPPKIALASAVDSPRQPATSTARASDVDSLSQAQPATSTA